MRLLLLAALAAASLSAAAPHAQPVQAPPARLDVQVWDDGAFRPLQSGETPATGSVDRATSWRGLVDGQPVSEDAFFRRAESLYFADKAVRHRRGARQAIAGGVLGVVVSGLLIATSSTTFPDDPQWAYTQQAIGTAGALLGMTSAVAGGIALDRNASTVWEARGAAARYDELALESER